MLFRLSFVLAVFLAVGCPAGLLAQNFRVQVGAFEEPVASSYFKDRGVNGVISSVDDNGIYRYFFGSYPTLPEAEAVQKQLIQKGFVHTIIIDLEVQRVLSSALDCPYDRGGPIYEENDSIRIIFFESGKALLDADGKADLDYMLKELKKSPQRELRILGYTDVSGSGQANAGLATERARTARNYLLDRGLPPERMLLKIFGESSAGKDEERFAQNKTELETARKRFRSVVLALVPKKKS